MNQDLNTKTQEQSKAPNDQPSRDSHTQSSRILKLAEMLELKRSPDGEAFALIPVGSHIETWPMEGKEFKNWLRQAYYQTFGAAPNSQALLEASATLIAKAQFEGEVRAEAIRVAGYDGKVFIDLCNEKWEAIEISIDGWKIIQSPPILFRRSKKMKALPYPVESPFTGDIDLLRPFLNLSCEDDFQLIMAFLLSSLNPSGPYLVLVLFGEHGTCKSTLVRVVRELIDPNRAPLRREPVKVDDLMVSARQNWVVAFDNVSHLPDWLSDDLCRLATGGALSKREHYTNDGEYVIEAKRPIILNGITEFVTKGDLASRSITLNLSIVEESSRKRESIFWMEFEAVHPKILGRLYTAISKALRDQQHLKLTSQLRMADAWHWATAAEPALGWSRGSMTDAFQDNQDTANENVLNSSVLFPFLQKIAEQSEPWRGTPSDLLSKINSMTVGNQAYARGWPAKPRGLTDQIRRINPALRKVGIEVQLDGRTSGSNSERLVTIRKVVQNSVAKVASPACDDSDAKMPDFLTFAAGIERRTP